MMGQTSFPQAHRHVIANFCCFTRKEWIQILMHRSFLCCERNSDCNLAILFLFMIITILATVGVRHPCIIILGCIYICSELS
jgi:hypothetical protein